MSWAQGPTEFWYMNHDILIKGIRYNCHITNFKFYSDVLSTSKHSKWAILEIEISARSALAVAISTSLAPILFRRHVFTFGF